jgi:hypothetical protein
MEKEKDDTEDNLSKKPRRKIAKTIRDEEEDRDTTMGT